MGLGKTSLSVVIAVAVTGLFLTMITAGALADAVTSTTTVPSSGTITAVNVGVYSDSGCTQNCNSLDWGSLRPGNSTAKIIYVKNTGNLPLTLSLTTTNWLPSNANQYLNLTWNRESYSLGVNSSVLANLTLTASPYAGNITNFSYNIVISGTQ